MWYFLCSQFCEKNLAFSLQYKRITGIDLKYETLWAEPVESLFLQGQLLDLDDRALSSWINVHLLNRNDLTLSEFKAAISWFVM